MATATYEVRYGAFTGRVGEAVTVSAGSDRDAVTQVADAEGLTRWVTLDGTRRHFTTKAVSR